MNPSCSISDSESTGQWSQRHRGGQATSNPPHNLAEVVEHTFYWFNGEDLTMCPLVIDEVHQRPDFLRGDHPSAGRPERLQPANPPDEEDHWRGRVSLEDMTHGKSRNNITEIPKTRYNNAQ